MGPTSPAALNTPATICAANKKMNPARMQVMGERLKITTASLESPWLNNIILDNPNVTYFIENGKRNSLQGRHISSDPDSREMENLGTTAHERKKGARECLAGE